MMQAFLAVNQQIPSIDFSLRLHQDDGTPPIDMTSYRRLIGRLFYLTNNRPDVTFSIQQLNQFMISPSETHQNAKLESGHTKIKVLVKKYCFQELSLRLSGFSYGDWGTCKHTKRLISDYYFFIGDSIISWKTMKQVIVAKSSSEVEYRALALVTWKLQWIVYLLANLKISSIKTLVLLVTFK